MLKSFVISLVVSLVVAIGVNHQFAVEQAKFNQVDYSQIRQATYVISNDRGNGSGVLIAPNLMLTVAHLVKEHSPETPLVVGSDKKPITILKVDESTDLALVWVDKLDCPCVLVAKYLPKVDDKVQIVGFPLYETVKTQILTEGLIQGFVLDEFRIVTSAPIAPGNSGGGLFKKNELIGIVSQGVQIGDYFGTSIIVHLGRSIDTNTINKFLKENNVSTR